MLFYGLYGHLGAAPTPCEQVFFLLVALTVLALAAGCASTKKISNMKLGEEQVVSRIPDKSPDWLNKPFEEAGGRYLFKGESAKGGDAALCMRQSKSNAVQQMMEAIKIKARSEFSEAVRGVNVSQESLGRYLDSVVAWTTENVEVSGIVSRGEYREKVQVRNWSRSVDDHEMASLAGAQEDCVAEMRRRYSGGRYLSDSRRQSLRRAHTHSSQ